MAYRTDLAVELLENLRGRDELSGVSEREYEREGLHIHEAEVTTERAARLLGKCRPRIGVDFIKTAKGMLTDEIWQELKNLDGSALHSTRRSSCRRGGLKH